MWESPSFASPRFDPAGWQPWTTGKGVLNDPTTTKQVIPAGTAAVVETSMDWGNPSTYDYWHNEFLP